MKKIDFTKEIPELIGLIEISERVEQMESFLALAIQNKNKIGNAVLEKLATYEQNNNVWLGQCIPVSYNNMNFLIQGLNDDENDSLNISPIEYILEIKDKQTKGQEGEKESGL